MKSSDGKGLRFFASEESLLKRGEGGTGQKSLEIEATTKERAKRSLATSNAYGCFSWVPGLHPALLVYFLHTYYPSSPIDSKKKVPVFSFLQIFFPFFPCEFVSLLK